jgi:hypothetical protein
MEVDKLTDIPPPGSSAEKPPYHIHVRELTIRCRSDCAGGSPYHEEMFDSPISAFRLWDGSPDLITTWASGSAYVVRIYHIADDKITKVLDQGTKSAPQFGFGADGTP